MPLKAENILMTRIAPTPSGMIHVGNCLNFILTRALANETGAIVRLRIDDMDALRVEKAYVEDVFNTLRWLEITWEQGPQNSMEHETAFSQKHRLNNYHNIINRLIETGKVYACACSRKQIETASINGIYTGTCRHKDIPFDMPDTSLRINVAGVLPVVFHDQLLGDTTIDLRHQIGDFVIRRKDGIPAYQVTSLCDDIIYGINMIVRGVDLLPSTAAQWFLAQLLNEPSFVKSLFYHHPLLNNEAGEKLSKSKRNANGAMQKDEATKKWILKEANKLLETVKH